MDIFKLRDLPLQKADRAMAMLYDASIDLRKPGPPKKYPDLGTLPRPTSACHASNRWHIKNRWRCRKTHWRSPVEVWNDPPLSLQEFLKNGSPTKQQILEKLCSNSYIAAQFNPYAAAAIYNTFSTDLFCRVLDPCAGWGDRLAAAMGARSVIEYFGVDANKNNQPGYLQQIKRYGGNGRFTVIHGAFEDTPIKENYYDIVFTSPPYFDCEIYSGDPEQSHFRYSNPKDWHTYFLAPLIEKSLKALAPGKFFILNIANAYDAELEISVPLIDIARTHAESIGFKPVGKLTLPLGSRKTEPIFIWRK